MFTYAKAITHTDNIEIQTEKKKLNEPKRAIKVYLITLCNEYEKQTSILKYVSLLRIDAMDIVFG
jgi:hypothetical protein